MKRLIKKAKYNVFKDLQRVKGNGEVCDGLGNEYIIPKEGYSKIYKVDNYNFRYNFSNNTLEIVDKYNDITEKNNLSVEEWVDNPEYWAKKFLIDLGDENSYELDF